MRNDELFSPGCPDSRVKSLVLAYALRGVTSSDGVYTGENLLAAQYKVYVEWLATVRVTNPGFVCCFHEWMARDEGDCAFIFSPGDLVKYNGRYCVVMERNAGSVGWTYKWRIPGDVPENKDWPQSLTALNVKEADGRMLCLHGLDAGLKPADIPPEVFALACGRAKECPMMKGGRDGE